MQELKLANDLFLCLFEGTKRATVRKGRREIAKGALALEAAEGGGWGAIVNVTDVRHKKLSELTDEEAQADNADNAAALADALKRFYPDIAPDSEITVILFDFKDPLEIPELVFDETSTQA
jgi:hypothetical protein